MLRESSKSSCHQEISEYSGSQAAGSERRVIAMVNPEESSILKHFEFSHLHPVQGAVAESFCNLAYELEETLPVGPEKSVALRKLLEAKDSAVRSVS